MGVETRYLEAAVAAATQRQLELLRDLAQQTGETFEVPRSRAHASEQIDDLLDVRSRQRLAARRRARRPIP